MKRLCKEAPANWITIGFPIGILLASAVSELPSWEAWLSAARAVGLLQWLSSQAGFRAPVDRKQELFFREV